MAEIFDEWPEKYDRWFETPIGRLVRLYESRLLIEMVRPGDGEEILDVGCGTGIFTADLLAAGSEVTGLDLSLPMLRVCQKEGFGSALPHRPGRYALAALQGGCVRQNHLGHLHRVS